MKSVSLGSWALLAIGCVIGWGVAYTHFKAKYRQEVQRLQIASRQDADVISAFAQTALNSVEQGDTNQAVLKAVCIYYNIYRDFPGADTNIVARIQAAARKFPLLAAELEKARLTDWE